MTLPSAMAAVARPAITMPTCSTWHIFSPVACPTCTDHFHPGSYEARPIVIPPIRTISNRPFSNSRTSSGLSNRFKTTPLISISCSSIPGNHRYHLLRFHPEASEGYTPRYHSAPAAERRHAVSPRRKPWGKTSHPSEAGFSRRRAEPVGRGRRPLFARPQARARYTYAAYLHASKPRSGDMLLARGVSRGVRHPHRSQAGLSRRHLFARPQPRAPPRYFFKCWSTHPFTVLYQSCEFCGFSTQ